MGKKNVKKAAVRGKSRNKPDNGAGHRKVKPKGRASSPPDSKKGRAAAPVRPRQPKADRNPPAPAQPLGRCDPQPLLQDPRIRSSRGSTDAETGTKVAPSRLVLPVKNWKDGELKRGDSVFYTDPITKRCSRYYVTSSPATWQDSSFVHLCSKRFDPTAELSRMPEQAEYFAMHVDCVTRAPIVDSRPTIAPQPTKAGVERMERARAGQKDIGDQVAEMLRGVTDYKKLCEIGAKHLPEDAKTLMAKYEHLDNGRRRMTIGNRIRAALKKGGK